MRSGELQRALDALNTAEGRKLVPYSGCKHNEGTYTLQRNFGRYMLVRITNELGDYEAVIKGELETRYVSPRDMPVVIAAYLQGRQDLQM